MTPKSSYERISVLESLLNDEAEEEGDEDGRKGELVFMLSFVEKLVLDVWLMSASWNILDKSFGKRKGKKEKEG